MRSGFKCSLSWLLPGLDLGKGANCRGGHREGWRAPSPSQLEAQHLGLPQAWEWRGHQKPRTHRADFSQLHLHLRAPHPLAPVLSISLITTSDSGPLRMPPPPALCFQEERPSGLCFRSRTVNATAEENTTLRVPSTSNGKSLPEGVRLEGGEKLVML